MARPPPSPLNLGSFLRKPAKSPILSRKRSRNENNNNNNVELCEEKWNSGIEYFEDEHDTIISIREQHKCKVVFGGNILNINISNLNKEAFLEDIPLIHERPVEPGYYTWIIYSNDDDKVFVASKAYSILELGTIHRAIAYRVKPEIIHSAGEIRVHANGSLVFNIISGTYMLPLFSSLKRSRCDKDVLETLMITKIKEFLGEDSTFTEETLITPATLPVTQQELDLYTRHGAVIGPSYNSPEECKAAQGQRAGTRKKRRSKRKTNKRVRR
jgi:hypothetical protein